MKSIERYYDEKTASEYESTRSDELWKRENSVFEAIISRITSGELNDSISSINRLKVLDLPAGTGRWIPFLQNRNIDYVGVDISEEMLEHAQGKLEGLTSDNNTYQFIQCPYQKYLPTLHDEFDLVICTRFLPHFSLKEVEKIVGLMAATTRKYLLLQVRVTDNRLAWFSEVAHFTVSARAGAIRRYKKAGRLTYSKVRANYMAVVEQTGMSVEKNIVRKEKFSSFEYWLLSKK